MITRADFRTVYNNRIGTSLKKIITQLYFRADEEKTFQSKLSGSWIEWPPWYIVKNVFRDTVPIQLVHTVLKSARA